MKTEMNILKQISSISLLLLLGSLLCMSCNRKDYYLKKAIQGDALICPIIQTNDLPDILISISSKDFLNELRHDSLAINTDNDLYQLMKGDSPISVSDQCYNKLLSNRISVDSTMNTVYKEFGICGLLKKYFKKEALFGGVYILSNQGQMFVVKGNEPYPSFGLKHNIEYMAYLLSKHDIYLRWLWIDEDGILMLTIAEDLSDTNALYSCEK